MSRGRNSSVISVRVSDVLANDIKVLASKRRKTVSELLVPAIERFVKYASERERWRGRGLDVTMEVDKNHAAGDPGSFADVSGARLSSGIGVEPLASDVMASPAVAVPDSAELVATDKTVLNPPAKLVAAEACESVEELIEEFKGMLPEEQGRFAEKFRGAKPASICPCGQSNRKYKNCHSVVFWRARYKL